METPTDERLLEQIRKAISRIGSVRRTSEITGIPAGTLNKYMAGTNMPSFDKAAKIAAAAGMSIGELAGEASRPDVSPGIAASAPAIVRLVGVTVTAIHKELGVRLPEGALIGEISDAYASLLQRMDDPSDLDEARALIPWLEARLKKSLQQAVAAPGTGKREAS